MKKITEYFRKLSLTNQVIMIILLFIIFFFFFFFLFLNGNIDRTIAKQTFGMMANRQQSLVTVVKSNNKEAVKKDYLEMMTDDFQVNCIIDHNGIEIMNSSDNENVPIELLEALKSSSLEISTDNKVIEKTVDIGTKKYFYREQYINFNKEEFVLASFMDDTYANELRSSLVDSTFDLTIFAYFAFMMILMIWVYSIIHPLNQIKYYIDQVRLGKDVELVINREDEIGEVAKALSSMKEELDKQEKAKEEMVHNISHDLKTPIATIKSYAESIKDGIYPYGTIEKSADVIIDNAQRLENKVHNLLYLNRVEYLLTSDAEGVVTNMKDVVEQVVLNSAVIRPEIEIQTDVEEVFFDGLLEAWRVAIENIMENAFRYAKSYIRIEVHENNLKISNDGPMMDEDRIDTLFRPYEKGEGGRFGLGLSIVSKVVKANKYMVKGYNTTDGVCFEIYREVKPEKRKQERKRINLRSAKQSKK